MLKLSGGPYHLTLIALIVIVGATAVALRDGAAGASVACTLGALALPITCYLEAQLSGWNRQTIAARCAIFALFYAATFAALGTSMAFPLLGGSIIFVVVAIVRDVIRGVIFSRDSS